MVIALNDSNKLEVEFFLDNVSDFNPSVNSYMENTVNLLDTIIDKGRGFLIKKDGFVVSFAGYTFGSPFDNFTKTNNGFINVFGVDNENRGGKFFLNFLKFLIDDMELFGLKNIAWMSCVDNDYNNNIYSKLGNIRNFINIDKNDYIYYIYGNSITDLKRRLNHGRSRRWNKKRIWQVDRNKRR